MRGSVHLREQWKLPKISLRDLLWLSGLLEGEGSFSLQHYHQGGSQWYALPSIEVQMIDRDVVLRVGQLLGGGQRQLRKAPPPQVATHKQKFIWRVNGRRAVYVMRLLLPHMGARRSRRIQQLVASYERTENGHVRRPVKGVRYRKSKEARRTHRERWRKRQKRRKAIAKQ
jgi:hypothetical protein